MEKLPSVVCPEPVMLTVTGSVLVNGAGVPVGIPNESSPGETETDVTGSGGTAKAGCEPKPASKYVAAKHAIKQRLLLREFIAHPFRRKHVDGTLNAKLRLKDDHRSTNFQVRASSRWGAT